MTKHSLTVTREKLYEAIWGRPMSKVAADWGVPFSSIAEACVEMNVPRPAGNHWQLVARGRKIEPAALLPPSEGATTQVVLKGPRKRPPSVGDSNSSANADDGEQTPPVSDSDSSKRADDGAKEQQHAPKSTRGYQVFISFKNSDASGEPTPDVAAARKVYKALRAERIRVFFSEECLSEKGKSEYARSIEEALESVEVLVLVGSCREYIESRWVRKEWDSFLGEVLAGRKDGELFIINCGTLQSGNLPLFLRKHQMFNADNAGLNDLVSFIRRKLPESVTLKKHIRLSLHCYKPEKNEDKIYLVTAHSPDGAGMNVTAHWGPRKAKQLTSLLKARNLESEAEVRSLVEKLEKEKASDGYLPVPHTKLLTREARASLEDTLKT